MFRDDKKQLLVDYLTKAADIDYRLSPKKVRKFAWEYTSRLGGHCHARILGRYENGQAKLVYKLYEKAFQAINKNSTSHQSGKSMGLFSII